MVATRVSGLDRVPWAPHGKDPAKFNPRYMYFLDLSALVPRDAFCDPRADTTPKDFWSLAEIAWCVFDPRSINKVWQKDEIPITNAVLDAILSLAGDGEDAQADDILNVNAVLYALTEKDGKQGFTSTFSSPHAGVQPTHLYIPELRANRSVTSNYILNQHVAPPHVKLREPKFDVLEYIEAFRQQHVVPTKEFIDQHIKETIAVQKVVAASHRGLLGFQCMLDSLLPADERAKLWTNIKDRRDARFEYIPPDKRPSQQTQIYAKNLYDVTLTDLHTDLSRLASWVVAEEQKDSDHKQCTGAFLRDAKAMDLLNALRDDSTLNELIADWDNLDTRVWISLEGLLHECFALIHKSPKATRDMIESEIMEIMRIGAGKMTSVPDFPYKSKVMRAASLLTESVAKAKKTTGLVESFSKVFSTYDATQDTVSTKGGFAFKILGRFSPQLMLYFGNQRNPSEPTSATVIAAWTGYMGLDEKEIEEAWKNLDLLMTSKAHQSEFSEGLKVFSIKDDGVVARARSWMNSKVGYSGAKAVVAAIAMNECIKNAHEDGHVTTKEVLEIAKSFADALDASSSFVNDLAGFETLTKATEKHGGAWLKKLEGFTDSQAFKLTKVVGSVLSAAIAHQTYIDTFKKKSATETAKDRARAEFIASIGGVIITLGEVVLGANPLLMTVLGIVLTVLVFVTLSEDFMAAIAGATRLPGFGKFYRKAVYEPCMDDLTLSRLIRESPFRDAIEESLRKLAAHTPDASTGNAYAYWDMCPRHQFRFAFAGIVHKEYGFPVPEAKIIASLG